LLPREGLAKALARSGAHLSRTGWPRCAKRSASKGARTAHCFTRQNRFLQLSFLPGNGVPLEEQVIWSSGVPAQPHGEFPSDIHSLKVSVAANSTSLAVCPDGHDSGLVPVVHSESLVEKGIVTVATTRPFFGCKSWDVLALAEVVFFFASLVQLPPPPAQAQSRLILAAPVTQRSVCPRPLASTSTPNRVALH